jgi:hypothetical protein
MTLDRQSSDGSVSTCRLCHICKQDAQWRSQLWEMEGSNADLRTGILLSLTRYYKETLAAETSHWQEKPFNGIADLRNDCPL